MKRDIMKIKGTMVIINGETTKEQFKQAFTSQKGIAKEINLDIVNDSVGNEFKVTIRRGVLDTIPKTDFTMHKKESTIQKGVDYSEGMVLKFFYEHPKATIDEAVDAIDELSLGGVKFIIAKLQQKGLLKRVGGRKHGEWVVCHDDNNTK